MFLGASIINHEALNLVCRGLLELVRCGAFLLPPDLDILGEPVCATFGKRRAEPKRVLCLSRIGARRLWGVRRGIEPATVLQYNMRVFQYRHSLGPRPDLSAMEEGFQPMYRTGS